MSLLKAGRQTHGLLLLALETLTTSLIIFLQVLSIEIEALTGHYLFSGGNANFVLVYKVQCHNDMCTCACCFFGFSDIALFFASGVFSSIIIVPENFPSQFM